MFQCFYEFWLQVSSNVIKLPTIYNLIHAYIFQELIRKEFVTKKMENISNIHFLQTLHSSSLFDKIT